MFGSVSDTRDTHGGENVDTPVGQCVLIGNFRRRLARELLVQHQIFNLTYISCPWSEPWRRELLQGWESAQLVVVPEIIWQLECISD